jgi:ferredoxin--NADP+ reductase
MFRIVESAFLAPDIKRFVIEAPRIARKRQAGQFVIVRVHPRGERIPLTIADGDSARCDRSTTTVRRHENCLGEGK